MSIERDWSDLPMELINLVSKKLPNLSDFIKFRVVCKTWCSSVPLSDHPPQLPWLIVHISGHLGNVLQFYSSFSGESGIIFRKEFDHGTNCMRPGSSHGSLLLNDRSVNTHSYKLFNPLTNEEIYLPPLHFSLPRLVWTGTNPTRNRNVIVIEHDFSPKNDSWAFYDRDNNDWILSIKKKAIISSCYFRGMLFLSNISYITNVFDVSTKKKLYKILPPDNVLNCPIIHLVESAGDILLVSLNLFVFTALERREIFEKVAFSIYKLQFDGRNRPVCWVKISNIGNQMLFLDAMSGFSINSRSFPGYIGNCIYFLFADYIPCRYNIENAKTERLRSPFVHRSSWFVPDLQ